MAYVRTEEQKSADYHNSKEFEQEVRAALQESLPWPDAVRDETKSNSRLDFWVPGYFVEVKEKRQPLTERWTKHWPGLPERDMFILDELSLRRVLTHSGDKTPNAYTLLRDLPGGDRMFLAGPMELAVVPRVRLMRQGKGKLIFNLNEFRRVQRITDLHELITTDLSLAPWKVSACLGQAGVEQV